MNIANGNAASITLINVYIDWGGDGELRRMHLTGDVWNGGAGVPSPVNTAITKNNVIASGATNELEFSFRSGTTATAPFNITLTFAEGGCARSISG